MAQSEAFMTFTENKLITNTYLWFFKLVLRSNAGNSFLLQKSYFVSMVAIFKININKEHKRTYWTLTNKQANILTQNLHDDLL